MSVPLNTKVYVAIFLTMNKQNAEMDYMEQIVKDSAALTAKNKACVTRWQDNVTGDVKLDGLR